MNAGSPGTTPNSHEHIIHHCTGYPNDDEISEWVGYFAATFNLAKPEAICEYIRWRHDGADLSELLGPLVIPPEQPPQAGPGTELKKLVAQLGIAPTQSCGCEAMAQKMNAWGVKGCRAYCGEILAHLRQAYGELNPSLTDKAAIGARALAVGLVINPLDPGASLLDEAIRRTCPTAPLPA